MTGDMPPESLRDPARVARLFWAVPVRGRIAGLAQAEHDRLAPLLNSPRILWHPADNWHLTLVFLGNTQLATGLLMADALRAPLAALAPFAIEAQAAEWFPSTSRPLVIALPVPSTPPLLALSSAFTQAAIATGIAHEARPFRGHVSLARVKHGYHPRDPLPPRVVAGDAQVVDEVLLYESVGTPDGVRYLPLLSLPLRRD